MKLLFTGNGRAGSWFIRGEQIGHSLGATVNANAGPSDFRAHDLTICVKRVPLSRLQAMRASGRPWVWDVVDAYPQPESSAWSQDQAIAWARDQLNTLRPDGVIWPNERMRHDVGFDGPQCVIYHHYRPNIRRNPLRETVQTIGYEGSRRYLDAWLPNLSAECAKRGWRFVFNPTSLAELDIVLALRGGEWDGYVSRHWKSNVKLANAHGSGTPFIGSPECGYAETASGAEYWARDLGGLRMAFDWLTPLRNRESVSERFLAKAYSIDEATKAYRGFLCALKSC
jgi:hypothetical protein